jgi:hypothetical protein
LTFTSKPPPSMAQPNGSPQTPPPSIHVGQASLAPIGEPGQAILIGEQFCVWTINAGNWVECCYAWHPKPGHRRIHPYALFQHWKAHHAPNAWSPQGCPVKATKIAKSVVLSGRLNSTQNN